MTRVRFIVAATVLVVVALVAVVWVVTRNHGGIPSGEPPVVDGMTVVSSVSPSTKSTPPVATHIKTTPPEPLAATAEAPAPPDVPAVPDNPPREGATEMADAFLEACLGGDFEKATKMVDPDSLAYVNLGEIRRLGLEHTFKGGQAHIAEVHVIGDRALAISNVGIAPLGGHANYVFNLVKRQDGWCLTSGSLCVESSAADEKKSFLSLPTDAELK